ncbi:efflux RND transporter permease subunit [Shewanella fidelis]|uniref:Efflux RND transporter permease subunit n=1 Tax=Shewanella fidelis TaxID=173509 RepID=A0AAW8NLZ9_9GAMM|nr:efflux RND transporter permease subunit [Shewanella fidelis]MDR8523707.1 efflux RND transporter permease subunit [Shewanella fidelis]MDW4810254.1 efflux RND transporter permease subunit [Shewanella fidelis]MDW4814399.1 efflux RND transporter permease subunit [Shewanella fidelis]MDW4818490.1 efflux RND transporter permease subunit [Shewanella fidelis]MDW4823858.1 efflux RND transporter permease subunit [Shewanella fidelis]
MNLAEFAIKQRVFVLFFSVLCVIVGLISYFELGKLEDPAFTVKSAVVVTLYPGASAKEIEQQVTDKIETKLQEMGSMWKLRSLSRPGSSMIFIDLKESTNSKDLPQEWDLLRRKIADVKLTLPATAQISIVQDEFSEVYGMLFSVHGKNAQPEELRQYAKELQRRIKTVAGIKKIELHGVQSQAVYIDLPDERLAQYGLSSVQVINQLASQNLTFDSGSFAADQQRIRIDQSSAFKSVNDIKNLIIKGGAGQYSTGLIRLGDIADVSLGYKTPATSLSRFNGEQAITLAVSPVNGINVVSLGESLTQIVADYQAELPLGIEIGTIAFQPDEVEKSIADFVINLLESVVIVFAVLLIFMGFKSATIVGGSLLFTILLTLIYMYIAGVDLQRVSLGTFILALGMLVDNAIVITDLFVVKLNQGIERSKAAIDSVKETAKPLLAATVIAIMGSSPVLFSQTDAGEFASSVFLIICSSLLFSWLVAVTLTPLLCWLWIKPSSEKEQAVSKPSRYQAAVVWTVNHPVKAISLVIPLLLVTALAVPYVAINFIPSSDRPMLFLDYWLPNGSKIEQTSSDMKKIEAWLIEQPEVTTISSYVGASAPRFSVTVEPEPFDSSYGQIVINVTDYDAIADLTKRGDLWLAQQFPNAEPRFRALKLATKDKFSIEARFTGPDPKVLHQLADEAKLIMQDNPNIKYVRDDWRQMSKVITPIINQEQARRAGLNRTDISMAMKRATEGVTIGTLNQADQLIPISFRSSDADLSSLETLPVRSMLAGHSVPLGQVVDGFELKAEESMIWRRNRVPTITAQADVFDITPAQARNQIKEQIEAINLPAGYAFEWGGEYYDENRAINDTLSQMPKALLMMVVIMVAMFNGFKQPAIILITLPLAAIGATWTLLLLDKPFGFMALIGAITLSGMIIKNGIVLMDQIELERSQNKPLKQAVQEATLNRTMAISMGALTTALGMIPLLSDRLFDQMAATIIGGLAAATLLSLFIMPAFYCLFYRNSDKASVTDNLEQSAEQQLAQEQ